MRNRILFFFILSYFLGITQLIASPYQQVWEDLRQRYVTRTQTKGIETTLVDYDQFGQSPSFLALIRYLEQAKIPDKKDAALIFWIDVYHMALVKAVSAFPRIETPTPEFYNTDMVIVSGIPMSLTEIRSMITNLTTEPLPLLLTDGTLGSPDFPEHAFRHMTGETYCQNRITSMLKNSSKSIRIDTNTRTLYASQYIVTALGENWKENPIIQKSLENINTEEYSVRVLPYDKTLNRRPR
jgi:hypothetical protein